MDRSGYIATPIASVIPAIFCLLFVLADTLPFSVLGSQLPPALLSLMPVYFWGLVRPDLMPPALVFATGLMEDLLAGGPAGVWALGFVATYALVDRQRDNFAGLSGFGAVLGFALAALTCALTAYVTVSIYYWRMVPLSTLLVQVGISVLYFIPSAYVLGFVHRRFVGAQRSDL